MEKITAIIHKEKLDTVRNALKETDCLNLVITEIEEYGNQNGIAKKWRGEMFNIGFLSKIKVEITVEHSKVEHIIKIIANSAKIGEIGHDKIFVHSIDDNI